MFLLVSNHRKFWKKMSGTWGWKGGNSLCEKIDQNKGRFPAALCENCHGGHCARQSNYELKEGCRDWLQSVEPELTSPLWKQLEGIHRDQFTNRGPTDRP